MPPTIAHQLLQILRRETVDSATVSGYFSAQWHNPSDILSVLLLLGPDIVQKAVAQLAGRAVTPVAFSFGWVAYAVSALMAAFGDGRLMPEADLEDVVVIPAVSGHIRSTKRWVLGRLLRDMNDEADKQMVLQVPRQATAEKTKLTPGKSPPPTWEALRVDIYKFKENPPRPHGVPTLDWVWYMGCFVIVIQLAISIVPWAVDGEWGTFLLAASGNALALVGGSLPHWKVEKWPTPKNGGATVTLTQGNGSRYAMVILGDKGSGLDLEILARGSGTSRTSLLTRTATATLTILWIVFLITVAGLHVQTWYLLGIGLIGSMQNLLAAGMARNSSALGIHIEYVETVADDKVAKVLRKLEEKHKFLGTSLVDTYFPGSLRVQNEELDFWSEAMDARYAANKYGVRLDCIPRPGADQLKPSSTE